MARGGQRQVELRTPSKSVPVQLKISQMCQSITRTDGRRLQELGGSIRVASRTFVVSRYCFSRVTAITKLWLVSGRSDGFSSERNPANTTRIRVQSAPSML